MKYMTAAEPTATFARPDKTPIAAEIGVAPAHYGQHTRKSTNNSGAAGLHFLFGRRIRAGGAFYFLRAALLREPCTGPARARQEWQVRIRCALRSTSVEGSSRNVCCYPFPETNPLAAVLGA